MSEEKVCLVTGATGQDGSWLIELLASRGHSVVAVRRPGSRHAPEAPDGVEWVSGDLLDPETLPHLIHERKPDEIYNLGALSHVGDSWASPVMYSETDFVGVVRLLEAVRRWSPSTRFYQASSSEVYGLVRPEDLPLNEASRRWPRSPYAVAKSAALDIVRNYRESYGLFACNGILFNHESERRGPGFVTRRITLGLAQWLKDGTSLSLGDVSARRDWGYAPDYVEAMTRVLGADEAEDFVIATGVDRSVADFATAAWKTTGHELEWGPHGASCDGLPAIRLEGSRLRPSEVPVLQGDASKARDVLGWRPGTAFDDWVGRMVNHDIRLLSDVSP